VHVALVHKMSHPILFPSKVIWYHCKSFIVINYIEHHIKSYLSPKYRVSISEEPFKIGSICLKHNLKHANFSLHTTFVFVWK